MLTRAEKQVQYEELRSKLKDANTVFLLDNTGLQVNEVNELRARVRQTSGSSYKVVKNSIVRLAVDGTPFAGIGPFLVGPKALAYTSGDAAALGKVLKEFIKTHPKLVFCQAYLEGQVLDATQAESIANLPTREEVISKLLFVLQSPMRRLAVALNGPIQNFASVVHQIADKKE